MRIYWLPFLVIFAALLFLHALNLELKASSAVTVKQQAQSNNAKTSYLKPAWPNPTLVVGLPKSGTKSVADYFQCGCYKVIHYSCEREGLKNPRCGELIQKNVLAGVDPLMHTGNASVYAQVDVTGLNHASCFYPQMQALEEIHQHHPNSTFILNTRNTKNWLSSVDRWLDMRERFIKCNLTDLPTGVGSRDEEMISFYQKQVKRIRDFCKQYPSHALVEIDVESNSTGAILEEAFGISSHCWGKNDHRSNHGRADIGGGGCTEG